MTHTLRFLHISPYSPSELAIQTHNCLDTYLFISNLEYNLIKASEKLSQERKNSARGNGLYQHLLSTNSIKHGATNLHYLLFPTMQDALRTSH